MRLFAILLALGFAAAQPAWVTDILSPSDRAAYCKQIHGSTSKNATTPNFLSRHVVQIDGLNLAFQTPRGSVYALCESAAKQLKAVPAANDLPLLYLVFIGGTVVELSQARAFAAAVALYNANGQEIARLNYDEQLSSLGDMSDWKVSCTGGGTCTWRGTNSYYFRPTSQFLAQLKNAHSFGVIANRGEGIKAYRITKANFPGLR